MSTGIFNSGQITQTLAKPSFATMKYSTALKFYKTSRAMAQAAGVTDQAVGQWKIKGFVPLKSAMHLQTVTGDRLRVDATIYARNTGKNANS